MTRPECCIVLRLAGPLQAWGGHSQFNRRDTATEPTKSGVVGLLAAAQGRRREDSIEDLLHLELGVRTDQPGSLLRDYHTVSDLHGRPLLSATVDAKGLQKRTSSYYTDVTSRFYLQDAVFVVAVGGPTEVMTTLREALRRPAFPLALGRRACVPTQPLLVEPEPGDEPPGAPGLWAGGPFAVLAKVPWAGSAQRARRLREELPVEVDLPVTVDDRAGDDVRTDLPGRTFDHKARSFRTRRVRQQWVRVPTGATGDAPNEHDPFRLLGW